jgi:hypothetical protein
MYILNGGLDFSLFNYKVYFINHLRNDIDTCIYYMSKHLKLEFWIRNKYKDRNSSSKFIPSTVSIEKGEIESHRRKVSAAGMTMLGGGSGVQGHLKVYILNCEILNFVIDNFIFFFQAVTKTRSGKNMIIVK